jgi:hypothetical protein
VKFNFIKKIYIIIILISLGIGMRMGKIMTKIALFYLLSKFNFEVADKKLLTEEIKFKPKQFVIMPAEPVRLRISLR